MESFKQIKTEKFEIENYRMSLFDKISSFFMKELGFWHFRSIYKSIKNLIRWFPIIWKDRDWDQSYIYDVLKFKLKNQAKFIGDRKHHVDSQRDSEIMNLCVRLIDKLDDGFYETEYFDYYESKISFLPVANEPNFSEIEFDTISENFDEYFTKYKSVYNKVLKDENLQIYKLDLAASEKNKKERIAMNIANYNHKRAKKLLFKLIEENIDGWWE